jgi:hypothetical protein
MTNQQIEIIIDELIPKTKIRLVDYFGIVFIKNFDITKSTLSYKLINYDIYNLLMEQLFMNDSLIMVIIDNIRKYRSTILVSNIQLFNHIKYKLNPNVYIIYYYGINLQNIPIYSTSS